MKSLVISLALLTAIVTLLAIVPTAGLDPRPAGFHFGISTVSAEDCPSEFQNCDGEGMLSDPNHNTGGGGGGGGGGGQRCKWFRDTSRPKVCDGSDCNYVEDDQHAYLWYNCRYPNGDLDRPELRPAGCCP